jgi:hypothetical protein
MLAVPPHSCGAFLHSARHGSVGGWQGRSVSVIDLWHLAGAIFPHVRDPWPESIGLGFPFATAGAGNLIVGVVLVEASPERRDRLANRAGAWGFVGGAGLYVLSLLVQLLSAL